jgi:hypothetical protein
MESERDANRYVMNNLSRKSKLLIKIFTSLSEEDALKLSSDVFAI